MALDSVETEGEVQNAGERRRELVEVLLKRGANPNTPSAMHIFYSSSPDSGKMETPYEIANRQPDSGNLKWLVQSHGGLARAPMPPAPPSTSSPSAGASGSASTPWILCRYRQDNAAPPGRSSARRRSAEHIARWMPMAGEAVAPHT